jgi:outer membrane receptor protein involved in Fe transport
MITALYNIIGKRIVAVGRPSPNQWEDIPNIYELPRNVLDLAVSKKLNRKVEIKLGIKDIFNERVQLTQQVNTTVDMQEATNGAVTGEKTFNRTQITKAYQPGRYFTISIGYKL